MKKFFTRLLGRSELAPPTAEARRRQLIERGRQKPLSSGISVRVVTLPTEASGALKLPVAPSILILQVAHIGDFVLSLPAVEKIREGFPGSLITLVSAPWNVDWARQTGFFDRVVAFEFFPPLNRDWSGPNPEIFDRFAALALGEHDIAVDFRHDADTRPCLYRVDAKVRAGYAAPVEEGRPHLDLMLPNVEHQILSNGNEFSLHAEGRLKLLADAVVSTFAPRSRSHPIVSLARQTDAETYCRPFAALSLGAGDDIRRWSPASFAAVARRTIDERQLDILIIGGSAEKETIDAVIAELPADRAKALVNAPLTNLPALLSRSSLFIGLGTGMTHLAAALGVPTVAVLSGVSPLSVWRPIGSRTLALTGETPCSPCGFKEEAQCPFGVACLNAITPDHVMMAVDRLLGAT